MSIQEDKFKEIANAIRPKLGTEELIEANNFAKKVGEIKTPTDGSIPTYSGSNVVYPSQSGTILATNQNYLTSDINVRGDQNFKAENIKKDVRIWGVTGTLEEAKPYIELPYIETNGENYIDTGFKANGVTTKVEIELEILAPSNNWRGLFGTRRENENQYNCIYITPQSNNYLELDWAGSNKPQHSGIQYNSKYSIICLNNTVSINGKVYTGASKLNKYDTDNFIIGRVRQNGLLDFQGTEQKIYKCKVWDNSILVRDLIPCELQNGAVGMWDKVENKFYKLTDQYKFKKITLSKNGTYTFPKNIVPLFTIPNSRFYSGIGFQWYAMRYNTSNERILSVSAFQNTAPLCMPVISNGSKLKLIKATGKTTIIEVNLSNTIILEGNNSSALPLDLYYYEV